MLTTSFLPALGQTNFQQLPATIDIAKDSAEVLRDFAKLARREGKALDDEIARILASSPPPDSPQELRADALSEANRIHFLDLGESSGRFPVELSFDEVIDFERHRDNLIRAIAAVNGQTFEATQRRMVDRNAFPPLSEATIRLQDEAAKFENLISIFDKEVLGRVSKPVRVGLILGAIALGALTVGFMIRKARK